MNLIKQNKQIQEELLEMRNINSNSAQLEYLENMYLENLSFSRKDIFAKNRTNRGSSNPRDNSTIAKLTK